MSGPINVKSPNNITNWQMRFNSAFKGLKVKRTTKFLCFIDFVIYCIVYVISMCVFLCEGDQSLTKIIV
jgi:t-SNARE complex subunit (syntaxin)